MKNIETYVSFVILCIIGVGVNTQTNGFYECTTPVNEPGLCLPLRNCTSLFNQILKGNDLTSAERLHLTRSQCGYGGNEPLVCCPEVTLSSQNSALPKPNECGISPFDKNIPGIKATLDAFPWMALLEYTNPNGTKEINCVGVLISKRYILTTARCVIGTEVSKNWNLTGVRLGEYNLLTDIDCEQTYSGLDCADLLVNVPISEKIIHELYNPQSINSANDIALLRMQSEISYSYFVTPICLPLPLKLRYFNYENVILEDVGWYRDTSEYSVKLAGHVETIENNRCNMSYEREGIYVEPTQLCGTSRTGSSGYQSCRGFSGSPIMKYETGIFYLAGLESITTPMCGLDGLPNVYTRVSSYIDWIESKVHP